MVPLGQRVQDAAPAAEKVPRAHTLEALRSMLGSDPASTAAQYEAPGVFEILPSSHTVQSSAEPVLSVSLYFPDGQGVQPPSEEPGAAQKPTGHSSHTVWSALETVPPAQVAQLEAPSGAMLPSGHGDGRPVLSSGQLDPAVHTVGRREPTGQKVPIGHSAEQRELDWPGVVP